jgi:O-antigen/teichoic acid export membrane protein
MKRFAINSIWMSAGLFSASALSVLGYVVAARLIGPAEFGGVLAAFGLAVIVVSFVDFGINNWTIREMVRTDGSVESYARTLGVKIALGGVLATLWLGIVGGMSIGSSRATAYLPFGIYIFFAALASTLAIPFRAQERFTPVAMSGVTEKASVLVILGGLVVANKLNAVGFSLALAVGPIASSTQLALALDRRFLKAPATTTHDIIAMWNAAKHFGLTGVASQVLRADVAIVAALSGASAAGIYAAPSRITLVLVLLPGALSITLFSRAARQTRGTVVELRAVLLTLLLLMLPVLIAIYIAAPPLVHTVLGSDYAASVAVLRILLLMVLMNTVNQPLMAALQARGEDAFVAATLWISAGIGLVGVAIGAAALGPTGAAFGAVSMQAIVLVALGWRVKSRLSTVATVALPHEAVMTTIEIE